jgi:hypothetical protein
VTQPALAQNVRGKGRHYQHPDGDLVPSITNIIGVMDKPAIPRWAAKLVAENAWKMRHSLDAMGEDECIDVLKGSPWRKSGRAAERGSSVHDYLECVAAGRALPDDLSPEAQTYIPAVEAFLYDHRPEFLHTEFTVFGDGYAGTGDFIARIGGQTVIGDYKTSKALYREVALQLAALRHANFVVVGDDLEPMPQVDGTVGVLFTPSGYEVRPVKSGPEVFDAFLGCLAAWHFTKAPNPIGEPLEGVRDDAAA